MVIGDSTGNGNAVVEPGEAIGLNLVLANTGPVTATGIEGVLTTTTAGVTIPQDRVVYPNIPVGGVGSGAGAFGFTVAAGLPCGTVIDFILTVNSCAGGFVLPFQMVIGAARVFFDNMELGAANWSHSGGAGTDSWGISIDSNARSFNRPRHGEGIATTGDQRLTLRALTIPAGTAGTLGPLTEAVVDLSAYANQSVRLR
jgi:hypothetical protein